MSSEDDHHGSTADDDFIHCLTSSQRELRSFIVGMTPSQADADDVLQEVNLALWRKRRLYDPQYDFLRWAIGFAVIEIRSFRSRSAKKRMWFCDSVLDSLAATWPHDSVIDELRRDALSACLQKLGTPERQVITGFYGSQLTVKELADKSGRPVSTVYKILTRAREMLRACVRRTISQAYHPG